jgi:hypothetical protein
MRIRQVKPEFFRDKDMAALPSRTRLTYIGLWCLADDAGWFSVDYIEIARELYGFDGVKVRERWVLEDLDALQAGGQIEIEPCAHALIPTLVEHQRFSAPNKRVFTILREHEKRCLHPPLPDEAREDPRGPASGSSKGKERKGTVDESSTSEFRRKVDFP